MIQNDPIAVLQIYGLDKALTHQDDPRLWAAALTEHWPRPDDPRVYHPPPQGGDLRGADLCGADLRGTDLRGANLTGADLREADLRGADLRGADLTRADLREANLCGASLFETNLRKANLRGADLTRADLREANLRGAKLILEGADLLWARLHGADLRKADLRKADLDVDAFDLTGFEPLPPYLRRFCFGIGKIPNESEKTRGAEWSGMAITERWAFERVDDEHFRATSGAPSLPDIILDVSRPSARTEIAWVHTGSNPAPLIGGGETRVWARQEDGSWIETDKVVSAWVT